MRVYWYVVCAVALLTGCGPKSRGPEPESVVALTGRLSRQHLPVEEPTILYSEIHIGPGVLPERADGAPVNVALVIDTSGSMDGRAMAHAKAAARGMIERLAEGDRVALVAFHSEVEVLMESTRIDPDDRQELLGLVDAMRAQGTTDMRRGLDAGLAQVRTHFDPQGINRVVLLGDGVPNDEAGIESAAEQAGREGISITAMGLGIEYNETLMGAIAQKSGGRFRYVDRPEKVADFFAQEVLRLQNVYAKNVRLELVFGPGVSLDVLGHPAATSGPGNAVSVELGDLSEREDLYVYARINAAGRADGAAVEIVDAYLSYDVPTAEDAGVRKRLYLGAHASVDAGKLGAVDQKLEHQGVLAEATHATLRAVAQARGGDRASADQTIDEAVERLERQAKRGKAAELQSRISELRALQQALPAPAPPPAKQLEFAEDDNTSAPMPAPAEAIQAPEQRQEVLKQHDRAMKRTY